MYNKRLSALTASMKEHKAKQLLKEKVDIFPECYKELFGKAFRENWCGNLKNNRNIRKFFEIKQRGKMPFRGDPPMSNGRNGGGRTPQTYYVKSAWHKQ